MYQPYKEDFFIKRNNNIYELIDSFSDDFSKLDKLSVPPPFMVRLRNEQANIKKLISRIDVIKNTDFAPSVYTTTKIICTIFVIISLLLKVEPWWGRLIISGFFAFILYAILPLIKDLEDPFEYDSEYIGCNEINLDILYKLSEDAERKLEEIK